MSTAAPISLLDLENDPRLFLYTSLTAGSSHIITATSRMETILKANKIPFQAIDMATDEKARRLWQRRSKGRKIPGLVKEGYVIAVCERQQDLNEVEDWNEFGELKQNIGPVPAANAPIPKGGQVGVQLAPPSIGASSSSATTAPKPTAAAAAAPPVVARQDEPAPQGFDKSKGVALPGADEIKARSEAKKAEVLAPAKPETMTSAPEVKAESVEAAKEVEATKEVEAEKSSTGDAEKGDEATEKKADDEKEEPVDVAVEKGTDEEEDQAEKDVSGKEDVKKEEATDDKKAEDGKAADEKAEEQLPGATETHRGSEVKEAPADIIKKVESDSAPAAVEDEDESDKLPTKEVEKLKVGDEDKAEAGESKTQEQSAKEPDDAGKSVED